MLLRGVGILFMLAMIGFHLLVLFLFNAPPNAVRIAVEPEMNAYIMPFFYQDWSFFAPTPIDHDFSLLARLRLADGKMTPWADISTPMIRAWQQNRLSAQEMLVTGVSNAMQDAARNHDVMNAIQTGKRSDLYEIEGPRILYRISAAVLGPLYADEKPSGIQVAIQVYEFPRFTKRYQAKGLIKPTDMIFPMRPLPTGVVSI